MGSPATERSEHVRRWNQLSSRKAVVYFMNINTQFTLNLMKNNSRRENIPMYGKNLIGGISESNT